MRSSACKFSQQPINVVLTAIFMFAVMEAAQSEPWSDEESIGEIRQFVTSIEAAYIARDWDRFADHFTDDALWMPNGWHPLQGRAAWWSFAERFWTTTQVVEMDNVSDEIIVSGDWAIERHTEVTTTINENKEKRTSRFKGVWILRRVEDGSWKIARYIWNQNPVPKQ